MLTEISLLALGWAVSQYLGRGKLPPSPGKAKWPGAPTPAPSSPAAKSPDIAARAMEEQMKHAEETDKLQAAVANAKKAVATEPGQTPAQRKAALADIEAKRKARQKALDDLQADINRATGKG
jgi:hypothetical protein